MSCPGSMQKDCLRSLSGEISLKADSQNLIESKSFKLYLNSFNQTEFPDWQTVQETLTRDLSACAEGEVTVSVSRLSEIEGSPIGHFAGDCIDEQDIEIDSYEFNAGYLADAAGEEIRRRVTGQPSAQIKLSDHPSARLGFSADPIPWPENRPRSPAALPGVIPSSQRISRTMRGANF